MSTSLKTAVESASAVAQLHTALKPYANFNPKDAVHLGKGSFYSYFVMEQIENEMEILIDKLGYKEIHQSVINHALALRVVDPINNVKYPGLLSNVQYEQFVAESRNITTQLVPPVGADPALAVVVPTVAQRALLKDKSNAIQQVLANHVSSKTLWLADCSRFEIICEMNTLLTKHLLDCFDVNIRNNFNTSKMSTKSQTSGSLAEFDNILSALNPVNALNANPVPDVPLLQAVPVNQVELAANIQAHRALNNTGVQLNTDSNPTPENLTSLIFRGILNPDRPVIGRSHEYVPGTAFLYVSTIKKLRMKYAPSTQADLAESITFFPDPQNLQMRNAEKFGPFCQQFLLYMAVHIKCMINFAPGNINYQLTPYEQCNILMNKIKHLDRFNVVYALLIPRLNNRTNFDLNLDSMITAITPYDDLYHANLLSNAQVSDAIIKKPFLNSINVDLVDRFSADPDVIIPSRIYRDYSTVKGKQLLNIVNNVGTKANPSVPVCHGWSRAGNCRYGDHCRYAHTGPPGNGKVQPAASIKEIGKIVPNKYQNPNNNQFKGGKPKRDNQKDKALKAFKQTKHQFSGNHMITVESMADFDFPNQFDLMSISTVVPEVPVHFIVNLPSTIKFSEMSLKQLQEYPLAEIFPGYIKLTKSQKSNFAKLWRDSKSDVHKRRKFLASNPLTDNGTAINTVTGVQIVTPSNQPSFKPNKKLKDTPVVVQPPIILQPPVAKSVQPVENSFRATGKITKLPKTVDDDDDIDSSTEVDSTTSFDDPIVGKSTNTPLAQSIMDRVTKRKLKSSSSSTVNQQNKNDKPDNRFVDRRGTTNVNQTNHTKETLQLLEDQQTFNEHYDISSNVVRKTLDTAIGDTGAALSVFGKQIDPSDPIKKSKQVVHFANKSTMAITATAFNKIIGRYLIAPTCAENVICIQEVIRKYQLHFFGGPKYLQLVSRLDPDDETDIHPIRASCFYMHTDSMYRVRMNELLADLEDYSAKYLN